MKKDAFKDRINIFESKQSQTQPKNRTQPNPRPLNVASKKSVNGGTNTSISSNNHNQHIERTPISNELNSSNSYIIKKEYSDKFPKDFEDYIQKIKNIHHPLEGCKKIEKIGNNENPLNVYQYLQKNKISSQQEFTVTIIFVGQSGAGKSTIINAYVNFLLGVYHDQSYRYKIVLGNKEKLKDITKSQTDDITIYSIKSPLYPGIIFKLIDTPGFADTENKSTGNKSEINDIDKKHLSKFEEFFNNKFSEEENGLINAICFVVKASENRVTPFQKLIITSILNLFGKNAGNNFLALLTHSDTCNPDAVKVMTKEIVQFKQKEDNNEKWYWCISSIKYFESLEKRQDKGKYEDNIDDFISFTNKVINLQAIDMTLTKKNLFLKTTLNNLKQTMVKEHLTILLNKYNLLKISETNLNEQISKCDKKNEELQNKINELNKKIAQQNETRNKINSLQAEINSNNNKIQQCNSEINNCQNDLKTITNSISSLETEIQKGENEKNNLNSQKILAENKLNEIQAQIKKSQENKNMNINLNLLEKELMDQKRKIETLNNNIKNLNSKKDEIQKQINSNQNMKNIINKKIQDSKNKIDSIQKEKIYKENEQINIMKQYSNINNKNYSIEILEEYIKKLEESKNDKKEIEESYIYTYEDECDERVLRCTNCKRNCHVDCSCNYGLFFFLGVSWWCNYIEDSYCNVCNCYYKEHQREKICYRHETRKRKKKVGLTDKEIEKIDKNIKEIRLKIKKEEDLQKKIIQEEKLKNLIQANFDKTSKMIENIKKLNTNEKNLNDTTKLINDTETKLVEDKNKKEILESNQKTKEKKINEKTTEKQSAQALINSKQQDIDKEKSEEIKLKNEVDLLTKEKNDLLNIIKTDFDSERNRLQQEKDNIDREINDTETETLKHIIKMKIITDEIKKIEIAENSESFDKQLNDIFEDNNTFIQNAENFISLKNRINTILKEPEETLLLKYGINKNNLIKIKQKHHN